MAMMNLQKLFADISKNENVKKITNELNDLGKQLNQRLHLDKNKTLEEAHQRYQAAIKTLNSKQSQIQAEVEKTIQSLRKSAVQFEKNMEKAKKQALAKKKKVEIMLKGAKKTTKKKRASKQA